jgi:hypothetical protein
MSPSERSQHPLTSHVSGIREIREREFNPSTCEVASSGNARGKANIASRGFVKGRCQGWIPQHASGEVTEESEPSIGRRARVTRSSLSRIQTSGVRGGSLLTSRVAKSREDQNHLSEEDRWQRLRDLTNSEVRKVKAQELGAPSHEW